MDALMLATALGGDSDEDLGAHGVEQPRPAREEIHSCTHVFTTYTYSFTFTHKHIECIHVDSSRGRGCWTWALLTQAGPHSDGCCNPRRHRG